jgi:hypothetical protein
VVVGQRLYPGAGRARGRGTAPAPRRLRQKAAPRSPKGAKAGAGAATGCGARCWTSWPTASAWATPSARACWRRSRSRCAAAAGASACTRWVRVLRAADLEVLDRPALPGQRPALCRPDRIGLLVQLRRRRLRELPRLRPCHRCRLRPGDTERQAHAARRRDQADADAGLAGMPGRPDAPCRRCRHPARHAVEQAQPEHQHWVINGSPNWNGKWNQHWFGVKRFFEYLETKAYKMHIRVLLSKYRSYTPCPRCAGARLKTESLLWRIGSKADADAVMPPPQRFMPQGVAWSPRAARGPARAVPARPDAAADRPAAPVLRPPERPAARARPRDGARPWRDHKALKLLFEEITTRLRYLCRRRHRLPESGPAEPHAVRRRGAAHQPDDRAGHLAGQHFVRAGRAQHRPAPARHAPHHRGHAAPARCRQHAGGGRARPGRDAGGRPHDRHGAGPGRTRRADRVRRLDPGPAPAPTR